MPDVHPSASRSTTGICRIEHFPINFFAVIMGLSGLTLATLRIETELAAGHTIGYTALFFTLAVFAAAAMLYLVKLSMYSDAVFAEWNHPVKIAFFPAISIGLLLTGAGMANLWPKAGVLIWSAGAVLQLVATLGVISAWISHRPFEPAHLTPAWFVPAVGNVLVPIGGVGFGFLEVSWFFFSVGMVFWVVLLTLVFNRLVFHNPLPERLLPTLVILLAPPSAGFIAWMQLSGEINPFGRFLYFVAIFFVMIVAIRFRQLARLPFGLSWWAYSFPIAAFTVATFLYARATGLSGYLVLGYVSYAVLVAVILLLVARTVAAGIRGQICIPD